MLKLLVDAATAPLDWSTLSQASAGGILAALVIAFMKGWVVPGSAYKEVCAQRDKAQGLVFELAAAAQRTIESVERGGGR